MEYYDKDFGKILKNNAQKQRHELLPQGTDCFRVYDRNLCEYPVTVDLYGRYARISDYSEPPMSEDEEAKCIDICSRMLYLEKENVVFTTRKKRVDRQQHEKNDQCSIRSIVNENGLEFEVELASYTDTGLFLDHMPTRAFIRQKSAGCDVLNLFSYTGSFSVYAASGMARSVISVDISNTYSQWAASNLARNGFQGENFRCIVSDAWSFICSALEKHNKYDIIIFDPPAFSNSHKMKHDFDVQRDYEVWLEKLAGLLREKGILMFSTNLGSFHMDRRVIRGLKIKEVTTLMRAPGFVKDRSGSVRSYLMAFDEDSLSLDWSEPKKEDGEVYRERREVKSSEKEEKGNSQERKVFDTERKPFRKEYRGSDNGRGRYGADRSERRYSSDRRNDFRKDGRSGFGGRREEHDYEKRERKYGRNEWTGDRSERSFDRERSRRDFDRNRSERSFDRERPGRDFGRDRSERSFDRERPRRDFGRDRSERSFDRERSRRDFDGGTRERERSAYKSKPYGYDSFRPAKNRDDSADFFWRREDIDKPVAEKKEEKTKD